MAIHITQFEKHKFVCGLFWQSLSRPRDLMREASDLARKIDSDLVVLRMDHSTAQAGFGQTRDGARRTMYSLAAVVSKTLALEGAFYDGEQQPVHNWLGAFPLPDGMWAYFAVRDANFLPNGDFAGTREEVLERLSSDYGLGGWNVVIGDPELATLGFHNFNARDIESFIPHKKDGKIKIHSWWCLRQINDRLAWLPVAAGVLVLIVLVVAAVMSWQYYQRKKAERERDLAMEAARRQILLAASAAARPWSHRTTAGVFIRNCESHFAYPTAGGWQLDSYICLPGEVTYSWSRKDSTIALLYGQVPRAVVDLSGDKAIFVKPLPALRGVNENLMPASAVYDPVVSRLQMMRIPVRTILLDPSKNAEMPPGLIPEWHAYAFSIKSHGLEPDEIGRILDRPGVRVDKLVYQQSEWTVEGTMYVK